MCLTLILPLGILLSCESKHGLKEEYKQMAEATSRLSNGKMFVIDSDSSTLIWEVMNQAGQKISGQIQVQKGSVILEKDRLVAGFYSGDVQSGKLFINQTKMDPKTEWKIILDSLPKLRSESGKIFKIEIEQSGHKVIRSGFKEDMSHNLIDKSTHLLQVNLTLADSSRSISMPAKFEKRGQFYVLDAAVSLNHFDFGLLYNRHSTDPTKVWNSVVPVQFHLVFKPYLENKAY